MKKFIYCLLAIAISLALESCGTTYVVRKRPAGYQPNFAKTHVDDAYYRPEHYRNFIQQNSRYLNDPNRPRGNAQAVNNAANDTYKANTYVDTHAETGRPVYHETYSVSYNENGEVVTTYTADYAGKKKDKEFYRDVSKEQKKIYQRSRKKTKYYDD